MEITRRISDTYSTITSQFINIRSFNDAKNWFDAWVVHRSASMILFYHTLFMFLFAVFNPWRLDYAVLRIASSLGVSFFLGLFLLSVVGHVNHFVKGLLEKDKPLIKQSGWALGLIVAESLFMLFLCSAVL